MRSLKISLALVLGIFLLTACSYESEYDISDEFDYYDGYDIGYEEGYEEAYIDAKYFYEEIIECDAIHYAREYSEWHPEEALCIIDAYESGESVSEEDYNEAVQSLYSYFEYLYYKMYN